MGILAQEFWFKFIESRYDDTLTGSAMAAMEAAPATEVSSSATPASRPRPTEPAERVEVAEQHKAKGNAEFQAGNLEAAKKEYDEALLNLGHRTVSASNFGVGLPSADAITDVLESPSTPGIGFVHFALSRNSSAGRAVLAGDRQAHLMYLSGTRGAYCTVSGQLSVLSDPESRRRYWKSFWAFSFPVESQAPAAQPAAKEQTSQMLPEAPSPWSASDYLLLRLAVTDISLHAMVDGPQRWQGRRVRRLETNKDVAGLGMDWCLVAPDEA